MSQEKSKKKKVKQKRVTQLRKKEKKKKMNNSKYEHCVVPENIHTPSPQKGWKIPGGGGWGVLKDQKILRNVVYLEFPEGWGVLIKNPFRGRGMDILWNYTLHMGYKNCFFSFQLCHCCDIFTCTIAYLAYTSYPLPAT